MVEFLEFNLQKAWYYVKTSISTVQICKWYCNGEWPRSDLSPLFLVWCWRNEITQLRAVWWPQDTCSLGTGVQFLIQEIVEILKDKLHPLVTNMSSGLTFSCYHSTSLMSLTKRRDKVTSSLGFQTWCNDLLCHIYQQLLSTYHVSPVLVFPSYNP